MEIVKLVFIRRFQFFIKIETLRREWKSDSCRLLGRI
jgi:hypothetical protein